MKVAIIGQGPKGLFALADLLRAWPAGAPLEVHCYDPRPFGDGIGYEAGQPEHQRINVRSEILHLPPLPPFPDWLRAAGIDPTCDVPRSEVSRYLAEARESLLEHAPRGVRVLDHHTRVRHLAHSDEGWLVAADVPQLVDEVLLSLGHAPDHDDSLARLWDPNQPTRLVPHPYPVHTSLGLEQVPPGCTVAVRGAGLTFLDVALALTEGRAPADRPARILPVAASGMLPLAKPGPFHQMLPDEARLMRVMASTMPHDVDGVVATVRQAAIELMVLSGHAPDLAASQVTTTLQTGWEPQLRQPPRALAALHRSIAVAELAARPGPAWMLARAWSALYPTVVEKISFQEHHPEDWQRFLDTSSLLSKLTFGPQLHQAIRLADLCEGGVVDLTWLESEVSITDRVHGLPAGQPRPDVVVDAVLSPPGALTARHPLIDDLLAQGLVHVVPGRRGLAVAPDASCLAPDGTPAPGLAALGRLTEDVVVGHDTLGRTLHQQSTAWAERLAASARGSLGP